MYRIPAEDLTYLQGQERSLCNLVGQLERNESGSGMRPMPLGGSWKRRKVYTLESPLTGGRTRQKRSTAGSEESTCSVTGRTEDDPERVRATGHVCSLRCASAGTGKGLVMGLRVQGTDSGSCWLWGDSWRDWSAVLQQPEVLVKEALGPPQKQSCTVKRHLQGGVKPSSQPARWVGPCLHRLWENNPSCPFGRRLPGQAL